MSALSRMFLIKTYLFSQKPLIYYKKLIINYLLHQTFHIVNILFNSYGVILPVPIEKVPVDLQLGWMQYNYSY